MQPMNPFTRKFFPLSAVLICLLLAGLLPPVPTAAQATQPNQVRVLFILDDSGSMFANDPTDLRYTAAKLFTAALDEADVIGAIRFSTQSQAITSGMVPVGSASAKVNTINALQAVTAEGYTDVKAAFTLAETMLKDAGPAGSKTIVILLTDGKPEIAQSYKEYESETIEIARRLNAPVYAIALTRASQTAFLTQITAQTGGRVIPAKTANDLLDSYLQILGDLKDRTITGEGAARAPAEVSMLLEPALMPYVSQVTFIVSKDDGVQTRLLSPDGAEILPGDAGLVFLMDTDPGFSAYTMNAPAGGEWKMKLTGNGSAQVRAILRSRLRTRVVAPLGMVEAGQPMQVVVNLIEEQSDGSLIKVVGDASFSALVNLPDGTRQSLDSFYDDGSHGDLLAGDGNFTREFVETNLEGTYGISVSGLKNVIPVNAAAQVQAIGFPIIVVDQPLSQQYEIHAEPIPLRIHLENIAPDASFEGGFTASLVAPSGKTTNVELTPDGTAYTGQFTPDESGKYTLTYLAVNAYYQGLPYQKQVSLSFEDEIFSKITVQSVKLGLEKEEPERFEIQEALEGIPLAVSIQSTSAKAESVTASLEGLSGFTLKESGPLPIAPNGITTLTLHLVGDIQLQPRELEGTLLLTPASAVDVLNNRMPIKLTLFTPTLTFTAETISVCETGRCYAWAPVKLLLTTTSTSLKPETVNIQLTEMPEISLSAVMVEVQPGSGQIELQLQPVGGRYLPGDYAGKLELSAQRAGVQVLPAQPLEVNFKVEPVWVSCKTPLIISGAILLLLVILVAMILKKRSSSRTPPIVRGTLTHWDEKYPDATTTVDLTALHKTEIRVGKGTGNDVIIPDESIAETHLVIMVEKLEEETRYMLQPMDQNKIRKGYRETTERMELEEKFEYQIGARKFVIIKDAEL